MAGVVKSGILQVHDPNGGGSGTDVNITGPLGSQPAADSLSVAIASDQLPLPVDFADSDVTAQQTWTTGVGGPIDIDTPGGGTVVVSIFTAGTPLGLINVFEQMTAGGSLVPKKFYLTTKTSDLSNPVLNYVVRDGNIGAGNIANGAWFNIVIQALGVHIQITNGLTNGSLSMNATFHQGLVLGPTSNVIVGGPNQFAADVTTNNKLLVTLTDDSNPTGVVALGSDNVAPSSASSPAIASFPLVFDGTFYDRLRGDSTNGAFVNVKTSVLPTGAALESGGNLDAIENNALLTASYLLSLTATIIAGFTPSLRVEQSSNATIAKESGGNLATLAAKDFATSAKQDTGNTSLASIDSKLTSPIEVAALVSDTPENYNVGDIKPLSLNNDGRLRVTTVPAETYLEFFREPDNFFFDSPHLTADDSLINLRTAPLDI